MGIEETVQQVKQQVLGSLEEHVYQQANAQNLVDTVLRTLVEGAVARLQVQMPGAASGVGALLGMFTPVASVVQSLGLDVRVGYTGPVDLPSQPTPLALAGLAS